MPQKIEVSHRTIIFAFVFTGLVWFFLQIKQILFLLFISFLLMSALNPAVNRLQKFKIPRPISIILIYIIFFGFLSAFFAILIPPLIEQTRLLVTSAPTNLEKLGLKGALEVDLQFITSQLGSIPKNVFTVVTGVFSNMISLFTVIVFTFYLLLERRNLDQYLTTLFGDHKEEVRIKQFIDKVEQGLGNWVRAQFTLMIIIGILSFLGLRLLGIEFALPLAILAGFLEVVPNIGPTIAAIPAIIAGLTISPFLAAAVAALYFLIQQFENNLVVPQIMKKATGINPLITIFALMSGFKVAGLMGAILAVPIVIVLQVVLQEIYAHSR
jgi:predicted PurR-regulated permease PerM